MATTSMDITSFVGKLLEEDDVDLLRDGVRVLAQVVMDAEVSSQIGAAPYVVEQLNLVGAGWHELEQTDQQAKSERGVDFIAVNDSGQRL